MKLTDLFRGESILIAKKPKSKEDAIAAMTRALSQTDAVKDAQRLTADVLKREESGSTAIGMGICTPHAKSSAVNAPAIAALTCPDGVDCGAPDGEKVRLFFLLAAPESGADEHLSMLSRLMTLLMDETLREKLIRAKDPGEFSALLERALAEKYPNEQTTVSDTSNGEEPFLVAVTACPTGIAHTFMAAEAMAKAAQKAGIRIKVETNGSSGAQNILTQDEIERADAVIVAADKAVETDRFDGKRVLFTGVSDGIRRPEQLFSDALRAGIHHAKQTGSAPPSRSGIGGVYRHLMNGVSHMLPFVVGGGIMIAIAFLIDSLFVDAAVAGGDFGTVTPIAAFFKNAGGLVFNFMLPVLAGYIALSIADRPGLVIGAAGAAMANSGLAFSFENGISFTSGGVSGGFLGALLAGFAAGYLTLGLKWLFSRLPRSLDGIRSILLLPVLGCILITALMAVVNPFIGLLNNSLYSGLSSLAGSGNIILLGAVLGGMMSIDMGGPFNKAAYTFATVSLAEQSEASFLVMAAVMAGGMIPPLAIALSTTFCPGRWTDEERKGGAANYLMGLSFISEGAIPYASADPLRVIPSCVAGSAVAGGLSAFFACTLRAPHGGIFVLPTIGNFAMYALAIAAGAAVGALLLSLLKKPPKAGITDEKR